MSLGIVQSKSAKSLSGNAVSLNLTSNATQGNGLWASVVWIDPNNNVATQPAIIVSDGVLSTWGNQYDNLLVPLGGDVYMANFFLPYVASTGSRGTITATATKPGVMFISVHEIQPDPGDILRIDVFGNNQDIAWDTTFSDLTNTLTPTTGPSLLGNHLGLISFGCRNGNVNPSISGWTNDEYVFNATPFGTLGITGSLATFSQATYAGAATVNFSSPSLLAAALITVISSVAADANPPTSDHQSGEYNTPQTVALQQDQGLAIYYTLDGTTPTTSSTLYSGPISISLPTKIKAIGGQPASGYPPGFWASSSVAEWDIDIFTGTCLNPANVIDGDDSTFAQLDATGSGADSIAVKVDNMNGTTGGPAQVKVDFEVTVNTLSVVGQTLPAWKVSVFIGGTEHVLASDAPGGGAVSRNTVSQAVSSGVSAPTLSAKVSATAQFTGSGAVQVKVYGAYLTEP